MGGLDRRGERGRALVGGTLVDLASWRAVFLLSVVLAIPTMVLLGAVPESRAAGRQQPVNLLAAALIIAFIGGRVVSAHQRARSGLDVGGHTRRGGNGRRGRGHPVARHRAHPLPFWPHLIPGTALFGLALAKAVPPLTHAAVSSVPGACAGTASGLHHATVRAAGLLAVTTLGSMAAGGADLGSLTVDGFKRSLDVCAMLVAVTGTPGALVTNEEPGGLEEEAA